MPRITFIGAGSTVFAKNLLGDLLSFPELAASEIYLHDLDPDRLATSEVVARRVAEALGARPRILATTDRERALAGAGYVICMIQVGGYRPATLTDFEVPRKYGLRQTIGDTLGVGGIMRGLRTIPVLIEICRDMARLCPEAWFLNYSNPMAINCWALSRATPTRTVGLCHSVPGTAAQLAAAAEVGADQVDYLCAGINHLAFFLRLEHRAEDLYPRLRAIAAEGRAPPDDRVRFEVLRHFGFFVTESSEHFAEYVPWFIKRDRPDLIERFNIPLDEYLWRCEAQIAGWESLRSELAGGAPIEVTRSREYAPLIIHSLETGVPRTVYGNVPNQGRIGNLPAECCVEVPCEVDHRRLSPRAVGLLPPQLAALIQTSVNVQALTVEAALTGRREHAYQAAMLDPHTAAELDLQQIADLVDDLLAAHGELVPELRA